MLCQESGTNNVKPLIIVIYYQNLFQVEKYACRKVCLDPSLPTINYHHL